MAAKQAKEPAASLEPAKETEASLGPAGRRLWDAILGEFALEEHERGLLFESCRTADTITALQAVIDKLGVDCAHRELAEIRQQRLAYARLLTALRLPSGLDDEPQKRPQRRGIRGVYPSLGGIA
jgi:hypothetical protein